MYHLVGFFKQCEKQCENFPPRCVFTKLFTVRIIAWNSWVPRRNCATCQEVPCCLSLAAPLFSQFGLQKKFLHTLVTNFEGTRHLDHQMRKEAFLHEKEERLWRLLPTGLNSIWPLSEICQFGHHDSQNIQLLQLKLLGG